MKKLSLLFALATAVLTLSGCNSKVKKIDYVHSSDVRLTYEYKNKDFYKDGIGQMELKMVIDGDTAHFNPLIKATSNEPVKSRYYGIDTPESTGKIQPYGHGASNFNKEKLLKAAENGTIVVSTPTGFTNKEIENGENPYMSPKPDATGSRYVSLIWINETKKNADFSELVLLNLWIVQEGFSWVKNVGEIPEYADTFYKAEEQAKNLKLNLFSGLDDPDMPTGEHVMADLLAMKIEMERLIADPTSTYAYDNQNLRVRGTVAGFANQTLYLVTYYSAEECATYGRTSPQGEWAGVNVYVGPAAIASRFTIRNTVVELCGTMGYSENFGVQLSGVNFPTSTFKNKDTDAKVVIKAEENIEEYALDVRTYNSTQLNKFVNDNNLECFNTAIQLGNVNADGFYTPETITCTRFYKPAGSNAITLSFQGLNFSVYVPFTYKPTDDGYTIYDEEEEFVGKRFQVSGVFAIHQGKSKDGSYYFNYQIIPSTSADLICLDA